MIKRTERDIIIRAAMTVAITLGLLGLSKSNPLSALAASPEVPAPVNLPYKVFLPFLVRPPLLNSDRVGVGYSGGPGQPDVTTLASQIGFKNYMDWDNTGRVTPGLSYMPMVLAWGNTPYPQSSTDPACDYLASTLENYPYRTIVAFGNEIGKDDGKTAEEDGRGYVTTRDCINEHPKTAGHGIRLTFGGMISHLNHQMGLGCVPEGDYNSGASFFIRAVEEMKRVYPTKWQPDLVKTNVYTECLTSNPDPAAFGVVVTRMEQLMDQEGITGQLVIAETAYSGYINPSSVTDSQKIAYFDGVINRVLPDKRILKVFWFLANSDQNGVWNSYLVDSRTGALTPLGEHVRDVLQTIDQR